MRRAEQEDFSILYHTPAAGPCYWKAFADPCLTCTALRGSKSVSNSWRWLTQATNPLQAEEATAFEDAKQLEGVPAGDTGAASQEEAPLEVKGPIKCNICDGLILNGQQQYEGHLPGQ